VKFRVVGADRKTGEDVEFFVEARDEVDAETIANRRNIMVSDVALVRSEWPRADDATPWVVEWPRSDDGTAGVAELVSRCCRGCGAVLGTGERRCRACRRVANIGLLAAICVGVFLGLVLTGESERRTTHTVATAQPRDLTRTALNELSPQEQATAFERQLSKEMAKASREFAEAKRRGDKAAERYWSEELADGLDWLHQMSKDKP